MPPRVTAAAVRARMASKAPHSHKAHEDCSRWRLENRAGGVAAGLEGRTSSGRFRALMERQDVAGFARVHLRYALRTAPVRFGGR
jgi:hypothetical protein